MIFLLIGAWEEWLEAWTTDELDPASPWKPLLWPLFAGILTGFAALSLQMIAECVRHFRSALGRGRSPLLYQGEDLPGT